MDVTLGRLPKMAICPRTSKSPLRTSEETNTSGPSKQPDVSAGTAKETGNSGNGGKLIANLPASKTIVRRLGAAALASATAPLVDAVGTRQALPAGTTADLKVVADFCHQLLRGNHHVSDEAYRATIDRFGTPATVQIAATVGYFVMQAVLLNAFEVAPEGEPSELVL